jgi:Fic family protein
MSETNLIDKLKAMDFQITPSALEVIKNSHMQIDDLLTGIKTSWKSKEKIITVKEAINLILDSRQAGISREIASEIKSHEKFVPVPKHLRRTYSILKRFEEPVTAGYVARITHRKKATEEIYLNQLVKSGFVKRKREGSKTTRYQIS